MSSGNRISFSFIELHTVDSTNNYAMRLINEGMAQQGTVVFAHEQTKGKGQRNKQWVSSKGENIMMSMVLQPRLYISQQFLLSMAVAVGVQQFFDFYTRGDTKIKWPNDIYWRDRKAGGILIENVLKGNEWKHAIIGVGININQTHFPDIQHKAVSLKQITGMHYEPVVMAKELVTYINKSYESLLLDEAAVVEQYHEHLYKRNEKVVLKKESKTFEALVKGVTPQGYLIAESFMEEHFAIGEIEWQPG